MVLTLNASCGSFVGCGRGNNEDNFYFNKKRLPIPNTGLKNPLKCSSTTDEPVLFSVFDGMGGECCGAEASCLSSKVFGEEYKKLEEWAMSGREFMFSACERANNEVNLLRESKQLSAVGTTVAAVWFLQDEVVACNVGDSRIFRIRDKKMICISEDHTDERILTAMGIRKKPVLLQYIGIDETEMSILPYISKGDIRAGDMYVLCSDGVTDVLNIGEMYGILRENTAFEAVKRILAEVDKKNGGDNATLIVIQVE